MNATMWSKLVAYLALVLINPYFMVGAIVGFAAKMMYGGQIISLGTGVFVGVLLFTMVQHILLR